MPAQGLIRHVVLIVKESHTFDNYFGTFPGANGDATLAGAADPPAFDPPHDHQAWLNRAAGAVRQQYTEADMPAYFAYAQQFTLCDNYFSEVASESIPNHLMLVAADSPLMDNPHQSDPSPLQPPFTLPSLPARLEKAGLDWRSYGGDFVFKNIGGLMERGKTHGSAQFTLDAANGHLPAVCWLYSGMLSERPSPGVAAGPVVGPRMQWTVEQVNAVVNGGLWPTTVIFITWADWGGWYDHVEPRNAEQWPAKGWPAAYRKTQFSYGPRVGCLVLSPYAKRGYISKVFHSHVSLVKFCETTFGLPTLNARDAKSDDMADCFDFNQRPAPPPSEAPKPAPSPQPGPVSASGPTPKPRPTPKPPPTPTPEPKPKRKGRPKPRARKRPRKQPKPAPRKKTRGPGRSPRSKARKRRG